MRIRGRGVRCASVVVVFLIAGCAGDAAGQHEEADADLSGAAAGKGRPLARSVGQQVRVQPAGGRAAGPWSVGIRINWNSFRGSLAGIDRRHSLVTQCSVDGACLPVASSGILPARDRGNPGLSAQGILLDMGRVVAPGTEIGAGVDLLSYTDTNTVFTEPAAALQATSIGERVQQLDFAGRITYTFSTPDGTSAGMRRIGPYVGVGAGVSRYDLRPLAGYPTEHRAVLNPFLAASPAGVVHAADAAVRGWAPNLQAYVGAMVRIVPWLPVVDVDFRYVHLAPRGVGLGSFRFGTGVRYLF